MAKKEHIETVGVPDDHGNGHGEVDVAKIDATMMLLTWITFFTILALLYKFAWKPILTALESREKRIEKSVEDAEKIRIEMEQLAENCQRKLAQAEEKAKEIVDESRKAGIEAAKHIQAKAKDEAQIILENARREINEEVEKAQARLREESADIAVQLAGKIIDENLNVEKNRKLINQYIKEL